MSMIVYAILVWPQLNTADPCADPESFFRGCPTLITFFMRRGGGGLNTTMSGPSSNAGFVAL